MGEDEAMVETRKICNNTPAFVASGYASAPIMANPEKYGFNAILCKPFKIIFIPPLLQFHNHVLIDLTIDDIISSFRDLNQHSGILMTAKLTLSLPFILTKSCSPIIHPPLK